MINPNDPRRVALLAFLSQGEADLSRAKSLITTPLDESVMVEVAIAESLPVTVLRSVSRGLRK
jgi:hypothetical protein